jgi:hypothetical protein
MKRWASAVLAVTLSCLLMTIAGIPYTAHVQQETEKRFDKIQAETDARWCALLTTIDVPGTPPTTARGREQVAALRLLMSSFGCEQP